MHRIAAQRLDGDLATAQRKRELIVRDVDARYGGFFWYVFTEDDTFWSARGLARDLCEIARNIMPPVPEIVAGGGLYYMRGRATRPREGDAQVDGPFIVVNRPLVARLANATVLDACRRMLFECYERPYEPNEGKFGCGLWKECVRAPLSPPRSARDAVRFTPHPRRARAPATRSYVYKGARYNNGAFAGAPAAARASRDHLLSSLRRVQIT